VGFIAHKFARRGTDRRQTVDVGPPTPGATGGVTDQGVTPMGGGSSSGTPAGAPGRTDVVSRNPLSLGGTTQQQGTTFSEILRARGRVRGLRNISATTTIGGNAARPNEANTPQGGVTNH
jgi:hypothetical protein